MEENRSNVFRKAEEADLPAIGAILRGAVARMLAEGKRQWDENYPNERHASADIANDVGYVMERDGEVVGYTAVVTSGEPTYASIDGKWQTNGDYVVVHRLAVSQKVKGKGIGKAMMKAVERHARSLGIPSFRIDTNFDNTAMLGMLSKLGFSYCGEIQYEHGSRKAFEKIL